MKNKTTRYLTVSLVLVSFFCVFVFGVQTVCMNLMRADAIRELGVIYMSGLSEQVAAHFGTVIELRLSQVAALVDSVPPGRYAGGTPMRIGLTYNARSMGFEYLALYTEDGGFHMLYGSQVQADVPEAFQSSVERGRYNVSSGTDETGAPVVLIGVAAAYPMGDGTASMALVAGLPVSYLSDTLEGSLDDGMVGYSIIRDDGSYVLQSSAIEEDNYFERVAARYEAFNGKEPLQFAEELRTALEQGRDYTSEIVISGQRWNVYCTSLPNSEWHLILKISHSNLDETINLLKSRWLVVSIGGCGMILVVLLLAFLGYFRLTGQQMQELEEARKTADLARASAERSSRAKNEFLSNMSHDIRTPMNGIMGMTNLAISSLDNPPKVRSCLKKINVSSRHLLGLINDMLDMSKIESGRLSLHEEPLSLREIMQNIMTIIRPQVQEKNQDFHIYIYDIYNENVCADRVRLSQILLNILGNAVKFTGEGGRIVMELREEVSPKGEAYTRSLLHIGDNGIGMAPDFLEKIFEAFAREDSGRVEREAGAGMGMTITKYIVDAMGGTIEVQSRQGEGSDFYITLDMEKSLPGEPDFCLPGCEVLLLEDDETDARTAASALESIGLHVETATDIKTAFRMLEERSHKGGNFHMILIDQDIEGRDGVQVTAELRSRLKEEIPVILLSDGESDEPEREAEEAGVNGMIAKPLFRSGLYYGLRKFAEIPHSGQAQGVEPDLAGRHVLVAEDNELNWEIADGMLSEMGMELDWAENGRYCVEKFSSSPVGYYDVILMDIRMPEMNGFEAASAIRGLERADAATIPIIAVSADAFADDVQKCMDCGMNAHTAKPYDFGKIIGLLNQLLQ